MYVLNVRGVVVAVAVYDGFLSVVIDEGIVMMARMRMIRTKMIAVNWARQKTVRDCRGAKR